MAAKKIKLPFPIEKSVLALGSHRKNAICFAKGNFAYLGRVHQDLNNPRDLFDFEKEARHFLQKRPRIIAYDLHPEYESTKYAQHLSPITYYLSPIQHHHAHIAACMADNGLENQKVIGVAFDGTGLGSDNRLWGAEFLICDYKDFIRAAHLKEIPLLGAERAILEPWRLAAWWLYSIYKDKFLNLKINFVKGVNKKHWRTLKNMYLSGFNSPASSSMGRLFDAAASLVLAKYKADFQAGLAIELEKIAAVYSCQLSSIPVVGGSAFGGSYQPASYPFRITQHKGKYIVDPLPMFKQIVLDLEAKEPKGKIAYRFHLTVAQMIVKICSILEKETKINKVVLSGGVFQNNLLLTLSIGLLYKKGFRVLSQNKLVCNDSSVSLGQAVVANFKIKHH